MSPSSAGGYAQTCDVMLPLPAVRDSVQKGVFVKAPVHFNITGVCFLTFFLYSLTFFFPIFFMQECFGE
jgi:hypothetical protein